PPARRRRPGRRPEPPRRVPEAALGAALHPGDAVRPARLLPARRDRRPRVAPRAPARAAAARAGRAARGRARRGGARAPARDGTMTTATVFAANGGVRIAYELRGAGKPLLLVHGLGYARWGWEPVV